MSWLKKPYTDKQHKMWDTIWGLHLLFDEDDPCDKNKSIFGVDDDTMKDHLLDDLIKSLFGEYHHIVAVCNNGTTSVNMVISFAASPTLIRLVGIGYCVDTYSFSERYSLVPVDAMTPRQQHSTFVAARAASATIRQ